MDGEEGRWPDERYWRRYTSDLYLLNAFPGSDDIEFNWSQSMQDMFVLVMHHGKRNGTYIEIGADQPRIISNTYLLENMFDWTGHSFELDKDKVEFWNTMRRNKCWCCDATTINYKSFFELMGMPKQIDYLQLDIDPPEGTLAALEKLPLDDYRFSVITYEHDLYAKSETKPAAEKIFLEYGYERVLGNVSSPSPIRMNPYEDWWVDPNAIDRKIINYFKDTVSMDQVFMTVLPDQ